jgi:gluconate kinase
MPKLTGSLEDMQQMNKLQEVIEQAIIPYRDNTEAIVVVGALMRVARILLRLYKPDLRLGFQSAAVAYLQGKATIDEEPDNQTALARIGFWVPPGSRN